MLRSILTIISGLIFSLTLSLSTQAAPAEPIKIKLATTAPANTPWADMLEVVKKRIAKESKGKYKIKTYLGGRLGGELEVLQKVRDGEIECGGVTAGALSLAVPSMNVLEIPFLFESVGLHACKADQSLSNHPCYDYADLLPVALNTPNALPSQKLANAPDHGSIATYQACRSYR